MVQTMYIDIVQQYKADVAFKTLVEGENDNLYFIPKYQRKFRWKLKQVQDLARSLVKGYPIPPIYAYRNEAGQLEILDGQQRVMSLYFYYIGKFIDSQKISAIDYRKLDVANRKYYDVFLLRLCTVDRNVKYENAAFLIENYRSNYAEWMDEFSKSAMQMKEENILHYKNTLNDFFMHFQVNKILGLQKALLESLFVVIVKAGLNVIVTDEIVNTILAAPEYKENSRQGMVQKVKMNERWKGVYAVLAGGMEGNS